MIIEEKFLQIIDSAPLVSIDLIIEDEQGQVLLGKRTNRPAQNYWFVPGGRIRKNEKLAEAILRISSNELGVEIRMSDAILLGAFDHFYTDNFAGIAETDTHYVALAYKAKIKHDFCFRTDNQHSEMKWWRKDNLLNNPAVHQNTKTYFKL